jgi:hypothetical protein
MYVTFLIRTNKIHTFYINASIEQVYQYNNIKILYKINAAIWYNTNNVIKM